MTQGKHTPGPWTVCPGDDISSPGIDGPDGDAVVWWTSLHDEGIPNHADAYRIAAAVNACEGIPTEALAAGVVKDILEALQEACDHYEMVHKEQAPWRAEIAKATGEKP